MKCNKCGAENQTSKFCSNCGTPIQQMQQPTQQPKKTNTSIIIIIIIFVIALPFIGLAIVIFSILGIFNANKDEITKIYEETKEQIEKETLSIESIGYWNCENDQLLINISDSKIEYIYNSKTKNINNPKDGTIEIENEIFEIDLDDNELELSNDTKEFNCKKITKSEYQELSEEKTSSIKEDIEGEYLSDGGTYYVFTTNEFYWYKDKDVKDDNYWYGTKKLYTYKETKEIDDTVYTDMGEIMEQGNYEEDEIFFLKLIPSKLISSGVDKSDTITPTTNLNMIIIKTSSKKYITVSYATFEQHTITKQ